MSKEIIETEIDCEPHISYDLEMAPMFIARAVVGRIALSGFAPDEVVLAGMAAQQNWEVTSDTIQEELENAGYDMVRRGLEAAKDDLATLKRIQNTPMPLFYTFYKLQHHSIAQPKGFSWYQEGPLYDALETISGDNTIHVYDLPSLRVHERTQWTTAQDEEWLSSLLLSADADRLVIGSTNEHVDAAEVMQVHLRNWV